MVQAIRGILSLELILIYIIIFNFDQEMTLDYRYIIKAGIIGVLSSFLISQAKELIQAIADMKEVKKADIKSLEDVQSFLTKKQNSRLNLLKLKPYYFQTQTKKLKIHSAQRYKFQPSDRKIVTQIKNKISSKIDERHNIYRIPVQWYAQIEHPQLFQNKKYCLIQGLGKIKGDFFDVKRQYMPKENLSYWSRFRNWIYQSIYKSSTLVQETKPFTWLIGPVVGILKYDISLIKDTKIIAVCNFQDGKIIPTVSATSKSQILNYYTQLIHEKYITVGALIVGTIFIARWLLSDIKKQLNAMKVRRNKTKFKYYNAQNMADDKMCIICYNHARNMIFFDCRHMIMCEQCSQTYDSDVCPYCKMEIDDIKPVIGIP